MGVLGTNVISKLSKPTAEPKVMAWVGSLPGDGLFTTAITRGDCCSVCTACPRGGTEAICCKA